MASGVALPSMSSSSSLGGAAGSAAEAAGMAEERFTALSKRLCYLLRHGLSIFEAKGCAVYGPGEGWVLLDDLLYRVAPALLRRRFTDDEIEACLRTSRSTRDDSKPRFELREWKRGRPRVLDAYPTSHKKSDSDAVTDAQSGEEMDIEEEHKERPVWLVRATYAHSVPLDKIQRRLPLNWDKNESGSSGESHPERLCATLIQRCIDVICANIKRYDGLGGVLDDALLRQIMTKLKGTVNISRLMISALLGHQLLSLDLEEIFVSDGVLRDIAKSCPSLAHLNLKGCFSVVTDQALQQLTKACKLITMLNIGDCKYITDKGLQAIARNLKRLEVLNVSNNAQITDSGLLSLKSLQSLKLLNVTGCSKLSKAALLNLQDLIAKTNRDGENTLHIESDQDEPIHFLGPDETPYGFLSSNSQHAITVDGLEYPTVQHFYQSKKYEGTPHEEEIRTAATPEAAFKLGQRGNGHSLREDWEDVKTEYMQQGLQAKFQQHSTLQKALLATGDRQLISRSRDTYWGQGRDGLGKNMQGRILMDIRDDLRSRIMS